jgi:site-specific recombinase XerD
MSHFSRWLEARGFRQNELTWERIEDFFRERRQLSYTAFRTRHALAPILQYLEIVLGFLVPPTPAPPPTALDKLLSEYERFLVEERALQPAAIRGYRDRARRFLVEEVGSECLELNEIRADDITSFILCYSRSYSIGSTKLMVTALRSLFRFLHLRGSIEKDLAGAVPAVAGWRQSGLPKFISSRELRRLLKSCDQRTHVGRRDFAILLLLARLGLRRGEVVAIALNDIHWRQGEIIIRGKGRRDTRLPLPSDVGSAVAAYIQRGRPATASKAVFLSCRAPYRPLTGYAITGVLHQASDRAGLPRIGSHRLRHTAATQMLREGATLSDIAQVLRHRSIDTTAIYAKVDHQRLRELAQPWPGGVA